MYNKIILVGNLTRDIEMKYTQNGTAIANTAIATTRKFTTNGEKKEEICFVDITFFGRIAEVANQYLRKGSKVLIEGRLNFEQWTDNNGQKRSKHNVIAETMQMLDSKPSDSANNTQTNQPQQTYQQPQQNNNAPFTQQQAPQQHSGYGNPNKPPQQAPQNTIDEESLPF